MRWRLTAEITAPQGPEILGTDPTGDIARAIFALFGGKKVWINTLTLIPVVNDDHAPVLAWHFDWSEADEHAG